MMISRQRLESAVVVKRTFLEVEGRSSSPDSRDDDKPKSGFRLRACSDSAIYMLIGDKPSDVFEPVHPNTLDGELVLTGLSDHEVETESTASTASHPISTRSASKAQPLWPRPRSPCNSELEFFGETGAVATTPELAVDRLANENARLQLENMILRQQCLEVVKLAQAVVKAKELLPSSGPPPEQVQEPEFPPMQVLPGSAHALSGGVQQLDPMSSGSPTASTMAIPAEELSGQPQSDGIFPNVPFGSFVWVPMEWRMPLCPQVSPMPPGSAYNSRISIAQSLASTKPPQQEAVATMHSRRKARVARAEQMFAKHAAVATSKSMPKVHQDDKAEESHEQQDDDLNQQYTCPPHLRTTVMLRNLPNNYSRDMLLDLINSEGFEKMYDFIYLPIDFKSRASLGYAFVNMINHEAAKRFRDTFDGFVNWILPSRKVCGVNWSEPHQGLAAHIERYRNSPVMHEAVPDIYRPVLFKDGQRVIFPPPTKKLRAPRIRHSCTGGFDSRGNLLDSKIQPGLLFQQLQESHELSGDEEYWR